ncbi:M23 family metallopeptidase [Cellulomonas sp. zg-ZUI22]|uniref:murein hydrolase activator EnvC family protein n=1 Tax=Cellulomonas sp. zg-ZUI22 TaxID=2816955 RepID=UPI0027DBE875|nr:M23 family metallopeptidase [Cellulomonas sp. zg-ZUI22]
MIVVALSVVALSVVALSVVALSVVAGSAPAVPGDGPLVPAPGHHVMAARGAERMGTVPAGGGSPPVVGGAPARTVSRAGAGPARAGARGTPVGGYRAPVDGVPRLLRAFDPPPQPWLAGHRGVDLGAGSGATVRAPAAGTVTFAGDVAGRGVVTVLHDDGLRSSLEPLSPAVAPGARVDAGGALGALTGDAHGGTPGGPALHWGVRDGDRYVDPWALLPGHGPVVLLPLR